MSLITQKCSGFREITDYTISLYHIQELLSRMTFRNIAFHLISFIESRSQMLGIYAMMLSICLSVCLSFRMIVCLSVA